MRTLSSSHVLLLALPALVPLMLALAACSSSSSQSLVDSGSQHPDSGKPKSNQDGGEKHDSEAKRDAALVCTPGFIHFDAGVDSGKSLDADREGGDREGGPAQGVPDAKAGDGAKGDGGDAGVDATPPTCQQACATASPGPYVKFQEDELMNCGCLMTGPCYSDCIKATSLDGGSPCQACLAAQFAEFLDSTCTLAAAMQCAQDPSCAPYETCVGACP
jgi:hypothetical protein